MYCKCKSLWYLTGNSHEYNAESTVLVYFEIIGSKAVWEQDDKLSTMKTSE